MSWPPPGVDMSLTDKLRRQAGALRQQRDSILNLDGELNCLRDAWNQRRESGADGLLVQAEDLARRAGQAGQPTETMLAGKLCGEILLGMQRFAEARARFQAVRDSYAGVVRTGGAAERDNDVRLLALMARAELGLKELAGASAHYGEAIAGIEADRGQISTPYLQSAFLKGRAGVYAGGVGVAFQLGDYETMLARAELSKARSVMRIQQGRKVPPGDPHLRRFREVCDRIREIDPMGDGMSVSTDGTLAELLEERRQLWDLLAIARFGTAAAGPPFSMEALRNAIDADTAILYYYWLDQNTLLVTAIDRQRVAAAAVALGETERKCLKYVLNTIDSLWGELGPQSQTTFDRNVRGCAALIPEEVREVIAGKRRLLFSPHRKLHLFPFHALPWGEGFLIETFAVSYIPNLSILLAPHHPAPNPKTLVAGVVEFPGAFGLPRLPAVEGELEGVAEASRMAGTETEVVEGAKLTRKRLADWNESGLLESFSCIHLATHGASVLAHEAVNTPMESRLFLFDGAWDGLEISCLRLNADLVVLSACNSGQRAVSGRELEELPGDDVFGIQSAFAMAGARAVLGCLWPANDKTAQAIMIKFHQGRAKQGPPDVALQQAAVEYLRGGNQRHCYLWAPFFLSVLGRQTCIHGGKIENA